MPKMRVDLHCDTLTAKPCFDGQIKLNELRAESAFQCFAAFTEDENAAAYAAAKRLFYKTFTSENGFAAIRKFGDVAAAQKKELTCCALTCENIGFTGGRLKDICGLKADGVIMASLVWNTENSLAYPNTRADGRRERRGLKKRGFEILEMLDSLKIIADVSHLSDGGTAQILKNRKIPVVASHSNCNTVCKNARNLTDLQLKSIADCGGVVGVNFYRKFLGGDGNFTAVAAHIKYIIKIAGEDVLSFGSDWDGTPKSGISICPPHMPELMRFLQKAGLAPRVLEKLAYKNFLRVFKEV